MCETAKIGIFGGSFDPPHYGHFKLAQYVLTTLSLDSIYFIPTSLHALKDNTSLTAVEKRYEMLCLAAAYNAKFRVSNIEVNRPSISYTVDTLREFRQYEKLVNADLYYIIGVDNLQELHLWKNPQEIFKLAYVVVLRRPGYEQDNIIEEYKDKIIFLESPLYDISSTEIREKIRKGISVRGLLPESVLDKIYVHGLYRS
jgi:nicotinate-nucleotide adenylyltransferase